MHSFDRRFGRVRTGVSDAVVLLPDGVDCFDAEALAAQVASTIQADLTTVRVVGAGSLSAATHAQLRHLSTDRGYRFRVLVECRDMRQVLRLETTFDEFLVKLGRSTRRNVETCQKRAARLGMKFRCVLGGGQPSDATELSEVAQARTCQGLLRLVRWLAFIL